MINLIELSLIPMCNRFTDLEQILATRISLVRSVRQKEERKQIGSFVTPFVRGLVGLEKNCLVRLSIAARKSNQLQVALNSIVKAQQLEKNVSFEVAREFANVLWLQKEQKLAVQYLKELVNREELGADGAVEKALSLARLVRLFFSVVIQVAHSVTGRLDLRGMSRKTDRYQKQFF
jgi:ataxia telangiectasia mutated family protein